MKAKLFVLIGLSILTACGGGGGGDTPTQPTKTTTTKTEVPIKALPGYISEVLPRQEGIMMEKVDEESTIKVQVISANQKPSTFKVEVSYAGKTQTATQGGDNNEIQIHVPRYQKSSPKLEVKITAYFADNKQDDKTRYYQIVDTDGSERLPPIIESLHAVPQIAYVNTQVAIAPDARSQESQKDTLTYEWQLIEKPDASVANSFDDRAQHLIFTPDATGNYTFRLTVNDGFKKTSADFSVLIGQNMATKIEKFFAEGNAKPLLELPSDIYYLEGTADIPKGKYLRITAGSHILGRTKFLVKGQSTTYIDPQLNLSGSLEALGAEENTVQINDITILVKPSETLDPQRHLTFNHVIFNEGMAYYPDWQSDTGENSYYPDWVSIKNSKFINTGKLWFMGHFKGTGRDLEVAKVNIENTEFENFCGITIHHSDVTRAAESPSSAVRLTMDGVIFDGKKSIGCVAFDKALSAHNYGSNQLHDKEFGVKLTNIQYKNFAEPEHEFIAEKDGVQLSLQEEFPEAFKEID